MTKITFADRASTAPGERLSAPPRPGRRSRQRLPQAAGQGAASMLAPDPVDLQPELFGPPAAAALAAGSEASPLALAEALGLAVFLCERDGLLASATREARALAAGRAVLDASSGRLRAVCPVSHQLLLKALSAAAPAAAAAALPAASILFLRGLDGFAQRAHVLPAPGPLRPGQRALALVSVGAGPALAEADLTAAAGLTISEAAVARLACEGLTAPQIAWERKVSVPTVRSQMKAAYAKLGVSNRAELASLLGGGGQASTRCGD